MQSFLSQPPAVLLDIHMDQSVTWSDVCFLPMVITLVPGSMDESLASGFVTDRV